MIHNRKKFPWTVGLVLLALLTNFTIAVEPGAEASRKFFDFGFMTADKSYDGRLFLLSQHYPQVMPHEDKLPGFLKISFKNSWREYVLQARDYCFDGNIKGDDVEDDFDVGVDSPDKWFHMPWQHYGKNGREGVHGLTKEAPIKPRQLAWTQKSPGQTYAVAFYNSFGAHEIGRVWSNPDAPKLHDISFPHGTVVFKLLFADIPLDEVPFLNPPVSWKGYITDSYESQKRKIRDLHLIQMDVMVRDNSSPHGWIFATYQYNGKVGMENRWKNLIPVGIQWGNDPDVRHNHVNDEPVHTHINTSLKETIINPDTNELPPTHLGWNGRLNGPVDNPMSTCMSCHAAAQAIATSPQSPLFQDNPPAPGSDEWMRWFKNYKCGSRFDEKVPSTDFSLQLAISIQNFIKWKGEGKGISARNYKAAADKASGRSKVPKSENFTEEVITNGVPQDQPVIRRDLPSDK